MTLAPDVVTHDAPNDRSQQEQYDALVDAGVSEKRARELTEPRPAFDANTTPNSLADQVGMDQVVLDKPPIAPSPVGERLVDHDGQVRDIAVPEDGTSVALAANHPKPWLDVQGHGARSADEHAAHDAQVGDKPVDGGTP